MAREADAIRAQRRIVIEAARHVRPVARRHFAPGCLFEVEDVRRLGRTGDDVAGASSDGGTILCEHPLLEKYGRSAAGRDMRARGEEAKELPSGVETRIVWSERGDCM